MTITATSTRDEKFRWLQRPFDHAISVGMFSPLGTLSLATSGLPLGYALAWQCAAVAVMTVLVFAGQLRMSRAAGKL